MTAAASPSSCSSENSMSNGLLVLEILLSSSSISICFNAAAELAALNGAGMPVLVGAGLLALALLFLSPGAGRLIPHVPLQPQ